MSGVGVEERYLQAGKTGRVVVMKDGEKSEDRLPESQCGHWAFLAKSVSDYCHQLIQRNGDGLQWRSERSMEKSSAGLAASPGCKIFFFSFFF